MKYIFLDVDGVLNNIKYTKKCYKKNGKKPFFCNNVPFNPKCLKRIAKIVKKTNAKLILSSTWRLDDISIKILDSRLAEYGTRINDITPNINQIRGLEIKKWLKNNNFNWSVDDFIVLDDEIEDIINHIDENKVIKIDPYYGLTWENMTDAIIRLSD